MKVIIFIVIILLIIAIIYFFFSSKKTELSYDDIFDGVLNGNIDVNLWSKNLPRVLGPLNYEEVKLMSKHVPCGKIIIIEELNKVWIGNNLFYIIDNDVFTKNRKKKIDSAIKREYAKALKSKRNDFKFPDYVFKNELKHMSPLQKVKYGEWRNYISDELNKKLCENRKKINSVIQNNYVSANFLEEHGLRREQVVPRATKIYLAREGMATEKMMNILTERDRSEIEKIVDDLQERRIISAIAKANEVPLPKNNAFTENNPIDTALSNILPLGVGLGPDIELDADVAIGDGNRLGGNVTDIVNGLQYGVRKKASRLKPGLDAAADALGFEKETIAERIEKVRKKDNFYNASHKQSVHDAIMSAEIKSAINDIVGEDGLNSSKVNRLADDFERLYPENASKYSKLFIQDMDKDYLKAFATVVYSKENSSVRNNLLEALNFEIGNIANVCAEGRKNKTWALLSGIDKTGHGDPIPTRVDIIDSLMHEFGVITNAGDLEQEEIIVKIDKLGSEYTEKYPTLVGEITKKVDEAKYVVEELFDEEVNLYGNTGGTFTGSAEHVSLDPTTGDVVNVSVAQSISDGEGNPQANMVLNAIANAVPFNASIDTSDAMRVFEGFTIEAVDTEVPQMVSKELETLPPPEKI